MSDDSTIEKPHCPKCKQKILQSISIKCMYCGEILPEKHRPSDEQKKIIVERQIRINAAHDLAMETKQAKSKKRKGAPTPPDIPDTAG